MARDPQPAKQGQGFIGKIAHVDFAFHGKWMVLRQDADRIDLDKRGFHQLALLDRHSHKTQFGTLIKQHPFDRVIGAAV